MTTPQEPRQLPDAGLSEHLEALRLRLEQLHEEELVERDQRTDVVVADLETAYEELRVADEEVRAQQDQITRLLERHNLLHWQHERMLAMLPVPALVTDSAGLIRSVNAPAAVLAATRVARMLGRPIVTLFAPEDRRNLRELLRGAQTQPRRQSASVMPRAGEEIQVDVWVTLRPGETTELTWLLLTPGSPHPRGELGLLPDALTELAGLPSGDLAPQEVLNLAAEICRRSLGGREVSIILGAPEQPDALSATSQFAQAVDGAQVAAGEGPCATAFATRAVVTSPDVGSDDRWPRLSRLLPHEKLSVVVAPVEVGQRLVGSLNVYGDSGPLETWVEDAAELLAATLGAVFYELELSAELDKLGQDMQRALASRAVIEQAKGIIMAQRGCGPDEAFALLAELSSRHERKLRDVARDIVDRAVGRG